MPDNSGRRKSPGSPVGPPGAPVKSPVGVSVSPLGAGAGSSGVVGYPAPTNAGPGSPGTVGYPVPIGSPGTVGYPVPISAGPGSPGTVGSPTMGQTAEQQRGGLATLEGMRYFDGAKPPPPPGAPPTIRGGNKSPRISEEETAAINKLSDYIEQLKAERELVESQIDSRRRELSDLADHTRQWQDQLVAQQQQGISQQKQFNEYMTHAKSQYETYMGDLFKQHKRAEEQKKSMSEMHARQNEENWRQIITQLVPEDTGSESDDEDLSGLSEAKWRTVMSKRAHKQPLSRTKITVKVMDGDEIFSFAVASNFWDELLDQISSVAGYSEHPLCHVGRDSEPPISINSSYLRYFASTWAAQRESYCVSIWQFTSWKFIDASDFWNSKADTDPPPLEYVTTTGGDLPYPFGDHENHQIL